MFVRAAVRFERDPTGASFRAGQLAYLKGQELKSVQYSGCRCTQDAAATSHVYGFAQLFHQTGYWSKFTLDYVLFSEKFPGDGPATGLSYGQLSLSASCYAGKAAARVRK